eukprot:3759942-Prymnesium_polylepis.1
MKGMHGPPWKGDIAPRRRDVRHRDEGQASRERATSCERLGWCEVNDWVYTGGRVRRCTVGRVRDRSAGAINAI